MIPIILLLISLIALVVSLASYMAYYRYRNQLCANINNHYPELWRSIKKYHLAKFSFVHWSFFFRYKQDFNDEKLDLLFQKAKNSLIINGCSLAILAISFCIFLKS